MPRLVPLVARHSSHGTQECSLDRDSIWLGWIVSSRSIALSPTQLLYLDFEPERAPPPSGICVCIAAIKRSPPHTKQDPSQHPRLWPEAAIA